MTGMLATSTVPLTYAFVAQSAGGRVSLPVAPSQILYANFAYVSGVAASAGEPVASIDRLKILDTLIARLVDMKAAPPVAEVRPVGMSSQRIDALIQQYGSELRSKVVAPVRAYSFPAPVESGMLFSLAA